MGLFTKTYTSSDIEKFSHKHKYDKLAKLLTNKDTSVATMASQALHESAHDEDAIKYRTDLFNRHPILYEGFIKKLEVARSSSDGINVDALVQEFLHEYKPLKLKKEAEDEEIRKLGKFLEEMGVKELATKNVKDLRALLGPGEVIESATFMGTRGDLVPRSDFVLWTDQHFYSLIGLANHDDWGSVSQNNYDWLYNIEKKGLLTTEYKISARDTSKENGQMDSLTVTKDHQILEQLRKYGSEEIKEIMANLGLMEEEA